MAYCTYSHRSAFHWQSDLSPERQDEIVAWVNSLGENEKRMIEEMVNDARDDATEAATVDECF